MNRTISYPSSRYSTRLSRHLHEWSKSGQDARDAELKGVEIGNDEVGNGDRRQGPFSLRRTGKPKPTPEAGFPPFAGLLNLIP